MEAGRADLASQIEAATKLVASNPPEPFLPIALYSLGLLEQKAGHRTEGERAFERLLNEFPAATGEVGLPLKPLARLKLIELATEDTNSNSMSLKATLTDLCASLVFEPTPLSLPILQILENLGDRLGSTTEVTRWRASWEHSEILREFYVAARPQLTRALPAFWLSPAEMSGQTSHDVASLQKWVALRPEFPPRIESDDSRQAAAPAILTPLAFAGEPDGMNLRMALNSQNFGGRPTNSPGTRDNSWVFCYEESELERRLGSCLSQTVLPGYVGIGFEIAGQKVIPPAHLPSLHVWHEVGYIGRRGGGVKKESLPELATQILAWAAQSRNGIDLLRVNVYLTSPSDLFKRQRTRTFWLGSVIGTSFITAIAGLFGAWCAFGRQQQLAEMKTNFVSSVSHELRAPIASVRLLAESLERGNVTETDKRSQYYRFIGQECRRLSSLIENVLDFSRIEQGRKQYQFEPTDLLTLARQTVALMESYAAEREVGLVLTASLPGSKPEHLELMIDGQAIQQAVINLIDNALKHSAKGQTVTVGVALETPAAEMAAAGRAQEPITPVVRIYVEDQGPGIPEREHERIFERFYRLGSELRRETQGIGIGLSIVKLIVEAHGGKVLVRSAPGLGSRFTIELPVSYGTPAHH